MKELVLTASSMLKKVFRQGERSFLVKSCPIVCNMHLKMNMQKGRTLST